MAIVSFNVFQYVFTLMALQWNLAWSLPTLEHLIADPESLATMAPERDIYADWTDWERWEPSPDLLKAFPYYIMGFDNEGRVGKDFQSFSTSALSGHDVKNYLAAYVTEFGKWDFRGWPEDRLDEFWKYFEQMVRYHERDASLNGGQGVVCNVDWDGFELNHHASQDGNNFGLPF